MTIDDATREFVRGRANYLGQGWLVAQWMLKYRIRLNAFIKSLYGYFCYA